MKQLSEIRVQIPNIPNFLDIYGHLIKTGYFLLARHDMGRVKSAVSGLTFSGRCGCRSICLANIQESLNVSTLREQRRQVAMSKHRLLTLALWTNLAMEKVINARKKIKWRSSLVLQKRKVWMSQTQGQICHLLGHFGPGEVVPAPMAKELRKWHVKPGDYVFRSTWVITSVVCWRWEVPPSILYRCKEELRDNGTFLWVVLWVKSACQYSSS